MATATISKTAMTMTEAVMSPAVTVIEITDPTAVNEDIELMEQDVVQLQPMPLRARRVIVRLNATTVVVFQSSNRRLRTATSVHQGMLAYVTFGPRVNGTVNGLPVRPGLMLAAEPETKARFVVDEGWESITFLVPPVEVRAHLAARQPEHEFHMPHGIETLLADPNAVRRLFDWGKRLTMTAASQPTIFNEGKNQRSAAQVELFEMLLPLLNGAEQLERTRSDHMRQIRCDTVAFAERYALSRVDDHPSVTDLCRAAGVSERTLQYAFHEVVGLTPVAYLIRLRLHRVREGLLSGTHGSTTVSTEALKWGFWHFGEFSRAYKDCFCELPSDTLRRTPPSGLALDRVRNRETRRPAFSSALAEIRQTVLRPVRRVF
jgi:AraC family transcriptional regulator, ethanolamine operon transcriptional activator